MSQLLFKQNTTVTATLKIKQQATECCFEETFLTENEYLKPSVLTFHLVNFTFINGQNTVLEFHTAGIEN